MQEALGRGLQRSRLTRADFEHYTVAQPEPLCAPWQQWRICTAPPPISGGLVALQILAMTGPGDIAEAGFAHRFLEAGRLAEADRRRYVADPDQVPVPVRAMLDPAYLAMRAGLIAPDRAMHQPRAGVLPVTAAEADPGLPTTATSQIAIAARNGDALSMTTSLTHIFGARVVADGMALNNALVNFAPLPPSGVRYANEMAPGKRPATPMAPVMVFDAQGEPVLLGGSGGGPGVPDYTAAALLDLLTGGRTPAQAVARGHISSAETDHVAVEAGTEAAALLPALEAMGHQAAAEPLPSGSAFLLRTATGWQGAADPRRDGVALGN